IQELKDNFENIEFIAFKNDDYFAITRTNEFILPNIKESLKIYSEPTSAFSYLNYKCLNSFGYGILTLYTYL
ncbi:MAG: hypothetical protein KA986_03990, partial [Aliarcobacter sp.]|nr:hypothetical protein [Aliarcobacter sp.]